MKDFDEKLNIDTGGLIMEYMDNLHWFYEPTPYRVLDEIVQNGYLTRNHVVVDYGCGKGRVGFYLNHEIGCRAIGIERVPEIYQMAEENRMRYAGEGVDFLCMDAEEYNPDEADVFYFFNPFQSVILAVVLQKIMESHRRKPRDIRLVFYFVPYSYEQVIRSIPEIEILQEIDCNQEGQHEPQRKLMIADIRKT